MKKFLIRFFLLISVVLIGYGKLYPNAYHSNLVHSSEKISIQNSEYASLVNFQSDDITTIKSPSAHELKSNEDLHATDNEVEEDESFSLKKYLEASNFFTAVLYAQILGFFFLFTKKRLSPDGLFSYFSSCRKFIVFRVIRI